MTEWRDIPGYEGVYQVSDGGEIRRFRRSWLTGRGEQFRKIKTHVNVHGYVQVSLAKNGKQGPKSLHRLMLRAFVGEPPEGCVSCHNDGNRQNNKISNLRWDTPQANYEDIAKHGTRCTGERHSEFKIYPTDIERIHDLHKHGCAYPQIAKWLGYISVSSVRDVVKSRRRFAQAVAA